MFGWDNGYNEWETAHYEFILVEIIVTSVAIGTANRIHLYDNVKTAIWMLRCDPFQAGIEVVERNLILGICRRTKKTLIVQKYE